jgi:predicted glycoside hydrolase/deacetylase ChbG (UPF0249 family)
LNTACSWSKRLIDKSHLRYPQTYIGFYDSGGLTQDILLEFLATLRPGVTELTCHPGWPDKLLIEKYGHLKYDWKAELEAITAEAVLEAVEKNEIELATYSDLHR